MPIVDGARDNVVYIDEAPKAESEKLVTSAKSSQTLIGVEKGKGKVDNLIVKTIPRPPPPFP